MHCIGSNPGKSGPKFVWILVHTAVTAAAGMGMTGAFWTKGCDGRARVAIPSSVGVVHTVDPLARAVGKGPYAIKSGS